MMQRRQQYAQHDTITGTITGTGTNISNTGSTITKMARMFPPTLSHHHPHNTPQCNYHRHYCSCLPQWQKWNDSITIEVTPLWHIKCFQHPHYNYNYTQRQKNDKDSAASEKSKLYIFIVLSLHHSHVPFNNTKTDQLPYKYNNKHTWWWHKWREKESLRGNVKNIAARFFSSCYSFS